MVGGLEKGMDMAEGNEGAREDLKRLGEMVDKLEGNLEEREAVDLLEEAVSEAEDCGRRLEERSHERNSPS
jgi:hypothetical protein